MGLSYPFYKIPLLENTFLKENIPFTKYPLKVVAVNFGVQKGTNLLVKSAQTVAVAAGCGPHYQG